MSRAPQTLSSLAPATTPLHNGFPNAALLAAGRVRNPGWTALRRPPGGGGRLHCLFSGGGNKKQEQAKKALESALGQKRTEFEKWNMEIERRQQRDRRAAAGSGGGWFGGGGWFRWLSSGDFWEAAKQTILTILGIIALFFLIANGNVLVAVVVNSVLSVLRQIRHALTFLAYCLAPKTPAHVSGRGSSSLDGRDQAAMPARETVRMSAKERVVRKWGMD